MKPAAELTEYERLMVCICAGVPYETFFEIKSGSYFVTTRTAVPCAVTDNPKGGYFVVSGSMRKEGPAEASPKGVQPPEEEQPPATGNTGPFYDN